MRSTIAAKQQGQQLDKEQHEQQPALCLSSGPPPEDGTANPPSPPCSCPAEMSDSGGSAEGAVPCCVGSSGGPDPITGHACAGAGLDSSRGDEQKETAVLSPPKSAVETEESKVSPSLSLPAEAGKTVGGDTIYGNSTSSTCGPLSSSSSLSDATSLSLECVRAAESGTGGTAVVWVFCLVLLLEIFINFDSGVVPAILPTLEKEFGLDGTTEGAYLLLLH